MKSLDKLLDVVEELTKGMREAREEIADARDKLDQAERLLDAVSGEVRHGSAAS